MDGQSDGETVVSQRDRIVWCEEYGDLCVPSATLGVRYSLGGLVLGPCL